jgi:hypothetical protein
MDYLGSQLLGCCWPFGYYGHRFGSVVIDYDFRKQVDKDTIALCLYKTSAAEKRSFFPGAPVAMIVANTSICTLLIVGRIWCAFFRSTSHSVTHYHLGIYNISYESLWATLVPLHVATEE